MSDFDESKVSRDDNGRFGAGGSSDGKTAMDHVRAGQQVMHKALNSRAKDQPGLHGEASIHFKKAIAAIESGDRTTAGDMARFLYKSAREQAGLPEDTEHSSGLATWAKSRT
jgi:hypothetical protein